MNDHPLIAVLGDLDITWHYEQTDVVSATSGRDFANKQWRGGAFHGSSGLAARQLWILSETIAFESAFTFVHPVTTLRDTAGPFSSTISTLEQSKSLPIQGLRFSNVPKIRTSKKRSDSHDSQILRMIDNLGWTPPSYVNYNQLIKSLNAATINCTTPDRYLVTDSTWGFTSTYHDHTLKSHETFRNWLATEIGGRISENIPIYIKYRTAKPIDFKPDGGMSVSSYATKDYLGGSGFDDNLLLCLAVDDLRVCGIEISRSISWERTLQCIVDAVANNFSKAKVIPGLQECRYVVITFSSDALVLVDKQVPRMPTLFCMPAQIEGDNYARREGRIFGLSHWVATFLAAHDPLASPETKRVLDRVLIESLAFMRHAVSEGHSRGDSETGQFNDCEFGYHASSHGGSDQWINSWPIPDFLNTKLGTVDFDLLQFGVKHHLRKFEVAIPQFSVIPEFPVPNTQSGEALRFSRDWWTIVSQNIHKVYFPSDRDDLVTSYVLYAADLMKYGGPGVEEYYPDHLDIPYVRFGKFITCDRKEIESSRTLAMIIKEYLAKASMKPLSIAVFGSPGSGKSFGIKELLTSIGIERDIAFHTFNLSQFSSIDSLPDCFHFIQNEVLSGKLPVVFWDEFDTTLNDVPFGWLSAFLAPMQDGEYVHGNRINPMGQCIFVFAGSRFNQFEDLPDPTNPVERPREEIVTMSHRESEELNKVAEFRPVDVHELQRMEHRNLLRRRENWRLAKGNDFRSRLKGHLNVRESNLDSVRVNGKAVEFDHDSPLTCDLLSFLIRRAMFVRQRCLADYSSLFSEANCSYDAIERRVVTDPNGRPCLILRIEEKIIWGFLSPLKFLHGTRSMESVLQTSALHSASIFDRSALAPPSALEMHVDPVAFEKYETLENLVVHLNEMIVPVDPISEFPSIDQLRFTGYGLAVSWSIPAGGRTIGDLDGVEVLIGLSSATSPSDCVICAQDARPPLLFEPSIRVLQRLGAAVDSWMSIRLGLRCFRDSDVGPVRWVEQDIRVRFTHNDLVELAEEV